jgi:hypothetical protein
VKENTSIDTVYDLTVHPLFHSRRNTSPAMSDNQSHDAEVLSPAHLDRFNVQTNHRKPTREEALGRVPISFEVKGFAKFGGSDLSFLRGFVMNPEMHRKAV